ncbi:PAP8 [Scenedesmus sp. PABB004]|nr:PAP8 [Scenedesmus sp. PABB004]
MLSPAGRPPRAANARARGAAAARAAPAPRPAAPRVACRAAGEAGGDPQRLVDRVLELVEGSDGGIALSPDQRAAVDALLDELEAAGRSQTRPLDSPLLWGNYNVAYTSTSRAPAERGQPAGGRFRGALGRALFRTTGVFQSVLAPDVAVNKVGFRLFGLLPGSVGLRGRLVPVAAGEAHGPGGVAGDGDTVRVFFEPPVLQLGGLHVRIGERGGRGARDRGGARRALRPPTRPPRAAPRRAARAGPPSSVQLSTPYLDERVRLGKGSRGSLFVFTRGGPADAAGMDRVGLQKSSPAGLAGLAAALAAMVGGGAALWATGVAALQLAAAGLWLVTAGLAAVLQQGGIIRDDADLARTQEFPGNTPASFPSHTRGHTRSRPQQQPPRLVQQTSSLPAKPAAPGPGRSRKTRACCACAGARRAAMKPGFGSKAGKKKKSKARRSKKSGKAGADGDDVMADAAQQTARGSPAADAELAPALSKHARKVELKRALKVKVAVLKSGRQKLTKKAGNKAERRQLNQQIRGLVQEEILGGGGGKKAAATGGGGAAEGMAE